MHIEENAKESWTFWQQEPQEGIAEPAILIERYSDSVTLMQDGARISLNRDSIDALCKHLKAINK